MGRREGGRDGGEGRNEQKGGGLTQRKEKEEGKGGGREGGSKDVPCHQSVDMFGAGR